MFDVYLNSKGDLLVVPRGLPIPNSETGRWRKKKTKVGAVSDEIRLAIQRHGYYRRKLGEAVSTYNRMAARSKKCDPKTASALLLLLRCAKHGRRADPSQSHASDPDDR
ncbi:hypothetical protein SAMN05443248_2684 [Bradyrhizobium erythrophlei]|uniref:Uncharacterized protein n=1 Tax=Bradyrhizobium erythrophlei TaxID=1437360 RepID=A0A1M5MS32_9BRAD|nr:hypothetical protein SAMN05443248_2684 [Bradyrhizobium erythrophlei]